MAEAAVKMKRSRAPRFVRVALITLGVISGIGVVSIAALMLSFAPTQLRLPSVTVGALSLAAPPAAMSISALPTGWYQSPAALTYRGGSWTDTRHLAATAVLVHHPKGDLLIDTGFGQNVDEHLKLISPMQRTPYSKGVPVRAQLLAAGTRITDLVGVVPTHAHWDHISGLDDLRGVPVLESVAGKRWIDSRASGTEVINSLGQLNYRLYDFKSGPYLGFSRSHDVFGDGSVIIVPLPAHTPDSVVVFVNLPSGKRYAFVGDLVFQDEGLELPAEKPWMLRKLIGENNAEVREGIALIRAATEAYPQIHAIPAHDSRAFALLPTFPASTH